MESDDITNVIKNAERVIKNVENFLESSEVICACYLYKYFETQDMNYFIKYKNIFEKLDNNKKKEAMSIFITFIKNNKLNNENSNKKLVKRKDDRNE